MKLILTRHGETIENKEGIMQGHLQGRLSEVGKEQARKLALRLKNEKIYCIYSSDLARAADTTKKIAKFHSDIPIHFVQELREMDLKELTGKNKRDIKWEENLNLIENTKDQRERLKRILDLAYKRHSKGTVLFVAHNGIVSQLLSMIMKKDPDHVKEMPKLGNTSVTIIEIKENSHEIKLLNCTEHLN